VEHTITECISGVDLVQTQLLLAQGLPLDTVGLGKMNDPELTPTQRSIQLRLCAEDPRSNFSLSVGNVSQLVVPSGHGVRVDTHFSSISPTLVGSDFDNLLAKIIITAGDWEAVIRKARRVLADTLVSGVKTNLNLLRGIMDHPHLMKGSPDTQWLESNLADLLNSGHELSEKTALTSPLNSTTSSHGNLVASSSNVLFRKGNAWSMTLEPLSQSDKQKASPSQSSIQSHLRLTRVLRNEFPSSLTAEVEYAVSSSSPSSSSPAIPYRLHLAETSASASALASSTSRRGDSSNPNHLLFPLSGRLTEILVGEGDEVARDQVVAYVKQMKMELEIRSHRPGVVKWVVQMEESSQSQGMDVAEGHLLLEFNEREKPHVQQPAIREKL
jgi:acetyl/propionyl-CoA carboxylase alpha subunit